MTERQIIIETLRYYRHNKRAVGRFNECEYLTETGDMCAVGRCLIDPAEAEDRAADPDRESTSVDDMWDDDLYLDSDLKPEYRGCGLDFWSDLQQFHDEKMHWKPRGDGHVLTQDGKRVARNLLKNYA